MAVADFVQSPAGLITGVVLVVFVVAALLYIRTERAAEPACASAEDPLISTVVTLLVH